MLIIGSIELELIPLMIASYHLDLDMEERCVVTRVLPVIVLGFPMYFVQPMQIVLNYILPISIVGMVSLFKPFEHANKPVVLTVVSLIGLSACSAVLFLRHESGWLMVAESY